MARVPPAATYSSGRCHSLYVCRIGNNQFLGGPDGWEYEYIAAGRYDVYPHPYHVSDTQKTFAMANAQNYPGATTREGVVAQPGSRTFVVNCVPGCFEIHVFSAVDTLADCDCGLIVVVPN